MAILTDDGIADLVAGCLRHLDKGKFQQCFQSLQSYEVMGYIMARDRVVLGHGRGIQRNIMLTGDTSVAAHVHLLQQDDTSIADHLQVLEVPWRRCRTSWSYIYQETLECRGDSLVTDIIKPREANAMISYAEELENKVWSSPGASNTIDPYGIPYWVVKNATTGFTGGAPSGHTTVGGISPTTYPNWKNYAGLYTNVSKTDLIREMRTAKRKTMFKSPVDINEYRKTGRRRRIYVNEDTINAMELLGEGQNENLGRDLASMDGDMVFHGAAIKWIPKLDEDTTNPVYMIDLASLFPIVLRGDFLRRTGPIRKADYHNIFDIFRDTSYNFVCLSRRANSVLATSAS